MKKIALVTHSYHQLTQSANIYIDEIFSDKEKFKIDIFYNYEWGSKNQFKLFNQKIENYDAVIILQLISLNLLSHINCKNIIFMPMYDYSRNFNIEQALPLLGLKILSPVHAMTKKLESLGLSSFEIKYFPEVEEYKQPDFKNIYFWNRLEEINYKTVLKIFEKYEFLKLNIHTFHDPGNNPKQPSGREIEKYNITFSDWFESRDEYISFLKNFGFYIAPRPHEGGGLASFMDAMKRGIIVVAPNYAPYNEYIENGKNGFLYDFVNPKSINFEELNLSLVSKSAYESISKGRDKWLNSIENLHEYIFSDLRNEDSFLFKKNLSNALDNPWYRFGKLNKKNKIKVIFKFIFNKLKISK